MHGSDGKGLLRPCSLTSRIGGTSSLGIDRHRPFQLLDPFLLFLWMVNHHHLHLGSHLQINEYLQVLREAKHLRWGMCSGEVLLVALKALAQAVLLLLVQMPLLALQATHHPSTSSRPWDG